MYKITQNGNAETSSGLGMQNIHKVYKAETQRRANMQATMAEKQNKNVPLRAPRKSICDPIGPEIDRFGFNLALKWPKGEPKISARSVSKIRTPSVHLIWWTEWPKKGAHGVPRKHPEGTKSPRWPPRGTHKTQTWSQMDPRRVPDGPQRSKKHVCFWGTR